MGLKKCCVGGCGATSDTHLLFSFPKNDNLRQLWMSFLVPTNSHLLGLTKWQLITTRYVCEKHFDKEQFDGEGRRLRNSYPCLFTEEEIANGVPLRTEDWSVLSEHNYSKDEDEDDITHSSLIIGKASDEHFQEHNYCSHPTTVTGLVQDRNVVLEQPTVSSSKEQESNVDKLNVQEHKDIVLEQPAVSPTKEKETLMPGHTTDVVFEKPSCSFTKETESTVGKRKVSIMKKQGSKTRKFIKEVIKMATHSLGASGSQRIAQAQTTLRNEQLFKNFDKLNKQAQTFLLMQLRECRKNKMARRFSLEEKLISLMFLKQSPKGYKLLEAMFALPSKRTLMRLSKNVSIDPGLNSKIFKYISNKTKFWNTKDKLCTIVFDEIALTPHLTFDENKDVIHGFVEEAEERKMKFCDHALVFMVRGICSPWRQTIAFYFCEGTISAVELQRILKLMVPKVAQTGLIPLGLVCDQGSTFRTAMKKFREDTVRTRSTLAIKDDGSIDIDGHNLSIFYDPPHLLKGMRNNFITKDIIWEGQTASWQDIQFIFDLDSKLGHTRALPKLTAHHIDPKKMKKMKVSVAAQVLSARTAAMLKYTAALNALHGKDAKRMATTAEVVEFLDNLFDSVNGRPGSVKRGKLRNAIKENSPHHHFWSQAIRKLTTLKFRDSSSKFAVQTGQPRLVRVPSLEGWITTIKSFQRISELLFKVYAVEYYYPRNINQDPLENFFGRIRAHNYRNTNPNANTFIHSYRALFLSNILSPHSKFSNCEDDKGEMLVGLDFLFEGKENDKENLPMPTNIEPLQSSSQEEAGVSHLEGVILEKVKVQCSAYTAGFICRKMTKLVNCNQCLKTYISHSVENIHKYINFREYKLLKNNNLCYPSEKLLITYRDAAENIHSYLNVYCFQHGIGGNLKRYLNTKLRLSWLGCEKHKTLLKEIFTKNMLRLHIFNWCKIINRILTGFVEERYVCNMSTPQKLALEKYKKIRLRKKCLNK